MPSGRIVPAENAFVRSGNFREPGEGGGGEGGSPPKSATGGCRWAIDSKLRLNFCDDSFN